MASAYDALLEAPTEASRYDALLPTASPYGALLGTEPAAAPSMTEDAPPVSDERRADIDQFISEHPAIHTDESIWELANKVPATVRDSETLNWLEQQKGFAGLIDKVTGTKTAGNYAVAANKGVRHLAEGFTTPLGIATLGLGGLPRVVQTAVGAVFAANMFSHLPDTLKAIGEAKTTEERITLVTEAIGAGAMLFGLGKHLAGRPSGGGRMVAPLTTAAVDATKPYEQSISDPSGSRQGDSAQRQTGHRGERGLRSEARLSTAGQDPAELHQAAVGTEQGTAGSVGKITQLLERRQKETDPAERQRLWDEAQALSQPSMAPLTEAAAAEVLPVAAMPKDPVVTSTKNAVVDAERLARGKEPLQAGQHVSDEQTWQQAESRLQQHPTAGAELVTELNESPRPITNVENDILLRHKIAVHTEGRRLIEEANREGITEPERTAAQVALELNDQAVEAIDTALKSGGTETGRALAARRKMANEDYALVPMRAKMRAVKGDTLTPAEETKAKDIAEKIETTGKEVEAKTEAAADAHAKDTFDQLLKTLRDEAKTSVKSGGKVADFLHEQAEKARARIRARGARLNAGLNPAELADHVIIGAEHIANGIGKLKDFAVKMVSEFGEAIRPYIPDIFEKSKAYQQAAEKLHSSAQTTVAEVVDNAGTKLDHRTVFDLARIHVQEGMTELAEVMKAVTADFAPKIEGLTERQVRDAFSDYGKVKLPNPAADAKVLRDLRAQGQLVSALEDVESGTAPKKSGSQRDKPSDVARELRRKLVAKMKASGIVTGDPATKLATAEQAKITALKNSITDLDKQLRTGEKPVKGVKVPDSTQVEALRAERDAMQAKLDEIEAEANPPKTDAQKQVDALAKIRQRLDGTLSGASSPAPSKAFEALSSAAEDIKLEITAMQELAAQMKRDARPKADPEAAREQAKIKALEDAIERYRAKTEASDFTAAPKRHGPDTRKVAALKEVLESRKSMYEMAKEAGKPVLTEEQKALARYKTAIATRTKELQRRLSEQDFSTRTKRTIELDREAQKARFENEQAKGEYNKALIDFRRAKRTGTQKAFGFIGDTLDTARAIKTSADLSAVLRQGGFIAFGNPVRALKAFPAMFRAFTSERAAHAVNEEIAQRPNAPLYKSAKLYHAEDSGGSLTKQEEALRSRWANHIPLVAGSQRAYTTFLNRLRADSFDALTATLGRRGAVSAVEADAIANFVNVATGRGDVGKAAAAANALNNIFFAPRFVTSRFQLLAGQPLYRGNARTRTLIAQEYAKMLGGAAVVYGLLSMLRDKKDPAIELDPRSTNFGKIQVGETHIDPLFGLLQSTTFASRMLSGQTKSASGKVYSLRGEVQFGHDDTADVLARFVRTKLAPTPGSIVNVAAGRDVAGNPTNLAKEALQLPAPISLMDIYQIMQAQGYEKGTIISLLNLFGMSSNTYPDKRK